MQPGQRSSAETFPLVLSGLVSCGAVVCAQEAVLLGRLSELSCVRNLVRGSMAGFVVVPDREAPGGRRVAGALVMERCPGGDLALLLERILCDDRSHLDLNELFALLLGTLRALVDLGNAGVVHQ